MLYKLLLSLKKFSIGSFDLVADIFCYVPWDLSRTQISLCLTLKVRSGKGGYKFIFYLVLVKVVPFPWPWEIWVRDYLGTFRFRFLVWGLTTTTNFIHKQIILQKHCPQLARLFKEVQCVQNMKLRLRLTKESLQITNKWNKNRNMDED